MMAMVRKKKIAATVETLITVSGVMISSRGRKIHRKN
jgi:hypothetical protein